MAIITTGVLATSNGRPQWQCGYSGCDRQRATKLNGELHRFCTDHRRRQNHQQRLSVERLRRGERRRQSRRRVRIVSTGDVWTQLELDALLDSTHEEVSTDAMIAECQSLLTGTTNDTVDDLMPLEEFAMFPIDSVDDILDLLPTGPM